MPTITRPDGSAVAEAAIPAILAQLGLGYRRVTPPVSAALAQVLADRHLGDARISAILDDVAPLLDGDHAGSDVVVLFPEASGLADILAAFARAHRHADDETRLILAGGGVFGFVLDDGAQVEITVAPGDLIQVPAGAEHWFRPDTSRPMVAVRLFQANPDWRALYTGTPVQFPETRKLYER